MARRVQTLRRSALLVAACFAAGATPAYASIVDQYNCLGGEDGVLTVMIAARDAAPAQVRLDDVGIAMLDRADTDLQFLPEGGAALYQGDAGSLAVISDKAVLEIRGDTHFCQIIAEEPEAASLLPSLYFDGSGFELRQPGIGSSRYDFGVSSGELVAVLGRFLGDPTDRAVYDEETACPGEVIRFADVTLYLADDRWKGWTLGRAAGDTARSVAVSGPAGATIGSPATMLQYGTTRYEASTLGDERIGDGVHYIVENHNRRSEISAMWAGESCVFR
ncbi:hypothetical protein [Qipengyuania aquimaris]|uniref:hypothetical protein n=1 Tax=Qipengyuania aquimaris TaxID=255984 RepID=UPI00136A7442|nr:hypothetical protein [Qipengyuania aquimaris]